jgi:hypothetical protein
MAQSIDSNKAAELIAEAEAIRKKLQMFIDSLKAAAGQTTDSGDGIAQGIVVRPPP